MENSMQEFIKKNLKSVGQPFGYYILGKDKASIEVAFRRFFEKIYDSRGKNS